jgi:hypothetical protein
MRLSMAWSTRVPVRAAESWTGMDQEFVTHVAIVEHLRQFREDGVVFFYPPSGEERTKAIV